PLMSEPGWEKFVLSHFERSECDENGRPFIGGLRRVAELLLGPTLSEEVEVVQPPLYARPVRDGLMVVQPAVVVVRVTILFCQGEWANNNNTRVFEEVGDAWDLNVDGPNFARFATPIARTRAAARAYRMALRLKVVADELTRSVIP